MNRYDIEKKRENLFLGSIVLLQCEFSYPVIDGCVEFFENMCEACFSFAKEKLYPMLVEEYENDSNPKKRFGAGFEYVVRIEEGETVKGFIELTVLTTVKKKRTHEILNESKNAFIIRLSDGALIPEKLMKRIKKRQNKQKKAEPTVNIDKNDICG